MPRVLLGFILLFVPALVKAGDVGQICDRNGVVLARIDYSGAEPKWEFPFGSLAIHVLEGLDKGILPKAGQKLSLTIDARIQVIAEEEMTPVGRGAVVVVDPADGKILAMASVPSHDPLAQADETNPLEPLRNRAISAYTPGAAFLPVTALAGASMGKHELVLTCSGGVPFGARIMRCNFAGGGHGESNVTEALQRSCNGYFYQYGNAAGISAIAGMGRTLGLGSTTDVPLAGEEPGILPSPEWLKENYPRQKWSEGYTANTSIGQGYVLTTPLQMTMVAATIANGGYSYYPRLIDLTASGAKVQPLLRANLLQKGVTPEAITLVREGLLGRFRIAKMTGPKSPIAIAGSRGVAQYWTADQKSDLYTFEACFAPYEKPRLAVCTFVQSNARNAIAMRIIERSLANKLPAPVFRKPNPGHADPFNGTEDSPAH